MKFLPKSRLDAFADGVFAIVITLLVLDLPIPESIEDITAFTPLWPDFLAYLISFAFIGNIWIVHSSITNLTKQETANSYHLNLLMLFFVSLLPFTTKLMATNLYGSNSTIPIIIYGLDLLAASVMLNWIMGSAANTPDLLVDNLAENELNATRRKRQYVVAINGLAVILALFFSKVAVVLYVVVAILFYILPAFSNLKWRQS